MITEIKLYTDSGYIVLSGDSTSGYCIWLEDPKGEHVDALDMLDEHDVTEIGKALAKIAKFNKESE